MLKLYNSLSRMVEEFKPLDLSLVRMYTCGPTVYQFAHIGNFRAYSTADILVRVLRARGMEVKFVMNITDVGHLTSDADTGEDKLEKSARKEGKTAWEVAEFYTEAFLRDYKALHMTEPDVLAKATDHIKEQVELIERLEKKGLTYHTSDGIYFDTAKFPKYGELSNLDEGKAEAGNKAASGFARVEINPEKKDARDFALWKFSYAEGRSFDSAQDDVATQRQMEWDSPWGSGFPGWHIECSAMSMKYLGEQLDIHTGGVDHKEIHHPNEIAQSEGATGKKFVNYWVHTAFMQVAGQKMSKSLGNIYTIYDLEKEARLRQGFGGQGFDPLALRYLYLQTHYRQEMNFTFVSLDAAATALKKLRIEVARLRPSNAYATAGRQGFGEVNPEEIGVVDFEGRFFEAVEDDLNMSKALAVVWELLKADYPKPAKAHSIFKMDEVLGLGLREGSAVVAEERQIVPAEVRELLAERKRLRKGRKFHLADEVRKKIEKLGYEVEDSDKGTRVRKK